MPKDTFLNLPEKKRKRVLEAAIDEFAKYSYYKARITAIVEDADIAKGSFYQYFKDKKDLYNYIIEIMGNKKLEYINHDMMENKAEYSFFELLRELYLSGIRFAKEYPRLVSITNRLINSKGNLYQEIFRGQEEKSISFFRELLKEGVKKGEISSGVDIELTSKLLTSLNYSIVEILFEDDEIDLDDMEPIDNMLYIIENGIKKKE